MEKPNATDIGCNCGFAGHLVAKVCNGKTRCHRYELKLQFCRASCGIPHHKPSYEAVLDEYDRRTGKVYVDISTTEKELLQQ